MDSILTVKNKLGATVFPSSTSHKLTQEKDLGIKTVTVRFTAYYKANHRLILMHLSHGIVSIVTAYTGTCMAET